VPQADDDISQIPIAIAVRKFTVQLEVAADKHLVQTSRPSTNADALHTVAKALSFVFLTPPVPPRLVS
jgi:hypothetical protein